MKEVITTIHARIYSTGAVMIDNVRYGPNTAIARFFQRKSINITGTLTKKEVDGRTRQALITTISLPAGIGKTCQAKE